MSLKKPEFSNQLIHQSGLVRSLGLSGRNKSMLILTWKVSVFILKNLLKSSPSCSCNSRTRLWYNPWSSLLCSQCDTHSRLFLRFLSCLNFRTLHSKIMLTATLSSSSSMPSVKDWTSAIFVNRVGKVNAYVSKKAPVLTNLATETRLFGGSSDEIWSEQEIFDPSSKIFSNYDQNLKVKKSTMMRIFRRLHDHRQWSNLFFTKNMMRIWCKYHRVIVP